MSLLANWFFYRAEYTEAQPLYQRALAIREIASLLGTSGTILSMWLAGTARPKSPNRMAFSISSKAFFGTFRNPIAHALKISWNMTEPDALDLLTMASFIHRRLDNAARTPRTVVA